MQTKEDQKKQAAIQGMAAAVHDRTENCGASFVLAICLEPREQGAELNTYSAMACDVLEPNLALTQLLENVNALTVQLSNGRCSLVLRGPEGDTEFKTQAANS